MGTEQFKEQRQQLQAYYGKDYYIDLFCEESSELNQALFKSRRYGLNDMRDKQIKEEFADVVVCLQHLQDIFKITDEDIFERVQQKLNRATDRMMQEVKDNE